MDTSVFSLFTLRLVLSPTAVAHSSAAHLCWSVITTTKGELHKKAPILRWALIYF